MLYVQCLASCYHNADDLALAIHLRSRLIIVIDTYQFRFRFRRQIVAVILTNVQMSVLLKYHRSVLVFRLLLVNEMLY